MDVKTEIQTEPTTDTSCPESFNEEPVLVKLENVTDRQVDEIEDATHNIFVSPLPSGKSEEDEEVKNEVYHDSMALNSELFIKDDKQTIGITYSNSENNSCVRKEKDKPYCCDKCSRTFTQLSYLNIHRKNCMGQHKCDRYKKPFPSARTLHQHKKISTVRVCELKQLMFNSLSLPEKIKIKDSGRPVPKLDIQQKESACKSRGAFTRKFDISLYDRVSWLCGCDEKNALFCFICLLFGGDDSWTREGVCDLKHLQLKIKKHENSTKHKDNIVSFQFLGKCNIAQSWSSAYKESVRIHNALVTRNRDNVSKIIDVLKLCGACNLPLPAHDESTSSGNKGIFLEIMEYSKNLDPLLRSHFDNVKIFKGTSKILQNELLTCMLQVCREFITDQIRQSSFLACMVDDTTDISNCIQTAIVFRYELKGTVYERYWGFFNAQGLSECILKELQPLLQDCPEKLIAQTYDGAAVFRGNVNVLVRDVYKNAHHIYYYAHQLNKLLEKASSNISSVKIFFANLRAISAFFLNSPDRRAVLREICSDKVLRPCDTRWNSRSRLVQMIFQNKDLILKYFENIQSGVGKIYKAETMYQAAGFIKWLNDDTFQFWLNFFNDVMPHADVLHADIQKIEPDIVKIQHTVHCFEIAISNVRNRLPSSSEETQEEPAAKRCCVSGNSTRDLNAVAREVCDCIVTEVRDRFKFQSYRSGAKLFQTENYEHYRKRLPVEDISNFCEAFPMVEKAALRTELSVFYSRPEFFQNNLLSGCGCLKTLNFLISYGLDTTAFKEITKTLKILVTLPMMTREKERCFSSLKLIKSFLRNSMEEDGLAALGMLSIEKDMIKEIPEFNGKVIDKFAIHEHRKMELHYK